MHMEAWDGPAGIVMSDGRWAICLLDRNGLRPARYQIDNEGYVTIASEIGVFPKTNQTLSPREELVLEGYLPLILRRVN